MIEWPHMKQGDAHWKITLLHILQEVRTIYKTRNQLSIKACRTPASGSREPLRGVCPLPRVPIFVPSRRSQRQAFSPAHDVTLHNGTFATPHMQAHQFVSFKGGILLANPHVPKFVCQICLLGGKKAEA